MSSIYVPSTLGASDNQITFNNRSSIPYYRMTSRTPTKRELVEFDIKLPEGLGDADFETLIGKTYLILTGKMYPSGGSASGQVAYDQGRRALRKLASVVIEQNDPNSNEGYVPYVWSEFDGNKQLFVKVEYVDLPENSRSGLKQPFNMVCKIKYPVILSTQLLVASLGSASASISGGIGYPFHYPVAYGATTYSSGSSINNAGDLPTYPNSITVFGPINAPCVTNSSTGDFIQFNINLPTIHDSLVITYGPDTLSATLNGSSCLNNLTNGSVFFTLKPGNSNLTLTGSAVSTGAYAVVTAYSAWPLS